MLPLDVGLQVIKKNFFTSFYLFLFLCQVYFNNERVIKKVSKVEVRLTEGLHRVWEAGTPNILTLK